METPETGRVFVEDAVENLKDLWALEQGLRCVEEVRRVVIPNALVDTGTTTLSLPTRLIQQLGLAQRGTKRVRTGSGVGETNLFEAVRLTIQGRDCTVDVMEVSDSVPPLIGRIPLEFLDFVIDPRSQTLIGNPEHGGEHMLEAY
ncbi:MAG: aspartyl protease family protein [Pirellulaceae bacterium]